MYTCVHNCVVITGRNEVVAKVMFLLVSVILSTGGFCLSACWDTTPAPPGADLTPRSRPPWSRHPFPREQTHTPPGGGRLQHTVNERPVRILLECILVDSLHLSQSTVGEENAILTDTKIIL